MNSPLPDKVSEVRIARILAEAGWHDERFDDRTTLVACTLPNGWRIVETSSCIDPANYDHEIGVSICRRRIEERLWELEGYLLMCQRYDLQNAYRAMCKAADECKGGVEWSINKVFVKVLDGEDLGWRFYAEGGGVRSPYLQSYDEAERWIADYDGEVD